MRYTTVSLFDLLNQEHEIGKSEIKRILSDFSCPLNPDVERFMHNNAYDFERIGLARTYLVYALPNDDESYLVGIYSLGQSSVEISSKLTKKDKKKIFGTTYPMGKNIKTLLIGQLAKNYTNGNDAYITGYTLLTLAFSKITQIHSLFPSVVTHIDCKDDNHLRKLMKIMDLNFYKKEKTECFYTCKQQVKLLNQFLFSSNKKKKYQHKTSMSLS